MSRRVRRRSAIGIAVLAPLAGACSSDGTPARSSPIVTFTTAPTTSAGSEVPPTDTPPIDTPPATGEPATSVPLGDPVVALTPYVEIELPVDLAIRPGDPTMYIADQDGWVYPVRDGVVGDPVLDITDLTSASGEQGLLGLAFHPTQPLAYVDYTDDAGDTRIDEYAVGDDGRFDPGSRREVLSIDQPYSNHNGGEVVFGPDGYLYIGTGDGGSGGDPERRGLNVSELLGKVLRIDPVAAGGQPYTVPADNPFVGVAGARPEVWSVGMRNPWRMTFDRETGDFWIADVGQGQWEEIDVAWADQGGGRGVNFGWSALEGTHVFNDDQNPDGATPPIYEYEHGAAGCSVSGGTLYRGAAIPALVGWYVYADYCSGQVRALQIVDRAVAKELVLGETTSVSAVLEDASGELFVLSLDGRVLAVTPG